MADDTKFYYVVAALGQDTAQRILDLIQNPPADNKYQGIKDRLTGTFGLSSHERAARIWNMGGLGDRKPSQLMDDMMALADGHHVCFLFEFAFLEQLPEDIRLQLANDKFEDLRALAKKADALWVAK